jgi:CubicO group peptidase (beta-lactamase class C family)
MKPNSIREAVDLSLSKNDLSGLAVAFAVNNGNIEVITAGNDSQGAPIAADSIFPLASLTKLAVALAILRLMDQGTLSVDDNLSRFVPEAAAAQSGVTLKRLLTHSAGMPIKRPAGLWDYDENLTWQTMAQGCLRITPDTPPGQRVMYDNEGYGLLAIVLERLTGLKYHEAVKKLVFEPLHLDAFLGEELPRPPIYLDDPADSDADTPTALWNSPFFHKLGDPWGGMMATPSATVGLLRAFLGIPEGYLKPATSLAATQDQAGGIGGGFPWQQWDHCPWGLGPEIILEGMQHWMDPGMRGGMIGHGGYSGCCVLYDAAAQVFWSVHGTASAAKPVYQEIFAKIRTSIFQQYRSLQK